MIASKLKQKYDNYSNLHEDERIYLREIVHQILCHTVQIREYLEVGLLIKLAGKTDPSSLF